MDKAKLRALVEQIEEFKSQSWCDVDEYATEAGHLIDDVLAELMPMIETPA